MLQQIFKKRGGKAGLPPGSLVHTAGARQTPVHLSAIRYDESEVVEMASMDVATCLDTLDKPGITWINVPGVHDVALLEALGKGCQLDPLLLEDLASVGQRPKVELYERYLAIFIRQFHVEADRLEEEQVALVVGEGFLMAFQEHEGDVFDVVRQRIRDGKGRLRQRRSDYLAYTLMDVVVDHYFSLLDTLDSQLERLGEEVIMDPQPATLQELLKVRHRILRIRSATWPLRDVLRRLQSEEVTAFFEDRTNPYLRDVQDHVLSVLDALETMREVVNGQIDAYQSSLSNRLNEVMKFLTIIGTIFIPLSFIAGVYGMNFAHMPELAWPYGYAFALILMATVSGSLLVYFRYRKWI